MKHEKPTSSLQKRKEKHRHKNEPDVDKGREARAAAAAVVSRRRLGSRRNARRWQLEYTRYKGGGQEGESVSEAVVGVSRGGHQRARRRDQEQRSECHCCCWFGSLPFLPRRPFG